MTVDSVEIPFRIHGSRQYLTDRQVMNDPALANFIRRFPNCFEWVAWQQIFVFYPNGDAPPMAPPPWPQETGTC